MSTRYVTVVFAVNDEDEFKPLWDQFVDKMLGSISEPWAVSAMSMGDEMTRVELLGSAVSELSDLYEIKQVVENISSTPLQNLEGKTVADFMDS
jgi:hypothetical protein